MCETLAEWIETHPVAPPRPRGERHHTSIYLSTSEAEHLSRLLIDHRLFAIHGGHVSELVRHALYAYIPQLLTLLEEGYKPLAELMRSDIERAGIGQTLEQINDYFETRGRELRMLVDVGETEKAFEHYEHVLGFVKDRQGVWASLMMRLLREHPEIMAFRDAVVRLGPADEARLRILEES